MKPEETPQGIVAIAFAEAIAAGDYGATHSLLSASLQASTSASQLTGEFAAMIDYSERPVENRPEVEVMVASDDWPGKQEGDIGWAYVAMSNDYYSEAVSAIMTHEKGRNVIREIDWGRP